jgi:hypothetical protein
VGELDNNVALRESPVTSDYFIERNQTQRDPFIFNPAHHLIIEGKSRRLPPKIENHLYPAMCIFTVLIGIWFSGTPVANAFWLIALLTLTISIVIWRTNRYLGKNGVFVDGQVVSAKIEAGNDKSVTLDLSYQLTSPQTGKLLRRREFVRRVDFTERSLPRVGQLVVIMYADDGTYRAM